MTTLFSFPTRYEAVAKHKIAQRCFLVAWASSLFSELPLLFCSFRQIRSRERLPSSALISRCCTGLSYIRPKLERRLVIEFGSQRPSVGSLHFFPSLSPACCGLKLSQIAAALTILVGDDGGSSHRFLAVTSTRRCGERYKCTHEGGGVGRNSHSSLVTHGVLRLRRILRLGNDVFLHPNTLGPGDRHLHFVLAQHLAFADGALGSG